MAPNENEILIFKFYEGEMCTAVAVKEKFGYRIKSGLHDAFDKRSWVPLKRAYESEVLALEEGIRTALRRSQEATALHEKRLEQLEAARALCKEKGLSSDELENPKVQLKIGN